MNMKKMRACLGHTPGHGGSFGHIQLEVEGGTYMSDEKLEELIKQINVWLDSQNLLLPNKWYLT